MLVGGAVARDGAEEGLADGTRRGPWAAKPKVGKTHFMLDAVASVLLGQKFLGQPTETVPIIYWTEERVGTFLQRLNSVGIDRNAQGFYPVLRQTTMQMTWTAVMREVTELAVQIDAGLTIIDTLSDWAALGGDTENDAGHALDAMRPVQELAEAGPAVVVCRHARKIRTTDRRSWSFRILKTAVVYSPDNEPGPSSGFICTNWMESRSYSVTERGG